MVNLELQNFLETILKHFCPLVSFYCFIDPVQQATFVFEMS